MALNISNTIITGVSGSDAYKINYNSTTDILRIDSTGRMFQPNQIGFLAGNNSTGAYVSYAAGWQIWNPPFNNVIYNVGSGFNSSTAKFTAPVSGTYIFTTSAWVYKAGGVVGNNVQLDIWVNDGTARQGTNDERIRLYGLAVGWHRDGQMTTIRNLIAGDVVTVRHYSDVTTNQFYNNYSHFAGALIG